LGNVGVDRRIILKQILKKQVVDWIQLTQDKIQHGIPSATKWLQGS